MAIVKSSPSELAIHGGGPPAFASRIPAFSANVGDGQRFGELAQRMFMDSEAPGKLADEFEQAVAGWLNVRNVVGFSSRQAAIRAIEGAVRFSGKVLVPAFGSTSFPFEGKGQLLECDPGTFGLSPTALGASIREDASAVFAAHVLGRPCLVQELEDVCEEWNVPLFFYGPQGLGSSYAGARLGGFGRAEIFDLGRDQLIHANDSAIVVTGDDLLAHRIRALRSRQADGIDQNFGDAAAAMGIANLESAEAFIEANRVRYQLYSERIVDVPGIKLVQHEPGSNFQSVAVQVDPGLAGITRDSLKDVLAAENVGSEKLFDGIAPSSTPYAAKLAGSILQLPAGPAATEEAIEAVCKLVELAIVRSLESPDPIRLAA